MATITIHPVLIEIGGPALLAVLVGASLVTLTWKPRRGESDPIRIVAVIEIVVVGFGVAVWQGITGNIGMAVGAFVVSLIGLVPAVRLITAAQDGESDDGWEPGFNMSLPRATNNSPEQLQVEEPVQACSQQRLQRTPDVSATAARIAGLHRQGAVENQAT